MKERRLGLLGKKLGMTRLFADDGAAMGVTVLELGPCLVVGKRTMERDGYRALILGFDQRPARRVSKPLAGQLGAVGGVERACRLIWELRVSEENLAKFEIGSEISLKDAGLTVGQRVDIVGKSKGRGFQGVMKRHNFAGFRATHGTHEYFRHGGSIGCRKWPGRVFKGRKMPGRMGNRRVTTQNVMVAALREDDNVLMVKGSVPGAKNGYVMVRPAVKKHPDA